MSYKIIENELLPIYENDKKEKLVNARELHSTMKVGRDFTNWIKDRIKKYDFIQNEDYILTLAKIGERQNVIKHEYYLTINMAKEIAMVENNEMGRKYFIEIEKRYKTIVETPKNIFDFMRLAIDQIEANEKEIQNIRLLSENNSKEIEKIQSKIDVTIKKEYCLVSEYKHYYEDMYIAIVPDISKGKNFWQIYYKPIAVENIIKWFNENKEKIEYKIIYQRNTKNGIKGETKEKGYKIDNICYKIKIV